MPTERKEMPFRVFPHRQPTALDQIYYPICAKKSSIILVLSSNRAAFSSIEMAIRKADERNRIRYAGVECTPMSLPNSTAKPGSRELFLVQRAVVSIARLDQDADIGTPDRHVEHQASMLDFENCRRICRRPP